MKFSCTRDNLHQGLSVVSHLTSKNLNLPILQNVLLKAEGGTISLATTNLEMAIGCFVRGKVEDAGEITIPSKLFFDYVSLLPNENVNIQIEGSSISVSCGNFKTRINGLPASDFPLVPVVKSDRTYQIPVETFRYLISQVLFAVATNEARPELTGISFQMEKNGIETKLICAATDSYRLAEVTINLASETQGEQVIIPAKTLGEVHRILAVFKDEVDVPSHVVMNLSDGQVVFRYGSVELISRTIEGKYPDYRQIIPKQFQTQAVLDREDFMKAVKTASLFSKNGLFDINLEFSSQDGQVSVRSVDATRGENITICPGEISGQTNAVAVNYRYLLDGLNAMNTDKIIFQMIDAGNPCVIQPKSEISSELYIVMPIKQ